MMITVSLGRTSAELTAEPIRPHAATEETELLQREVLVDLDRRVHVAMV